MFIAREEHDWAVYMLRNTRTGAAYVGCSRNITQRLNSHEINIRLRSGKGPTCKRILKAFPNVAEVEFRILEFVEQKGAGHLGKREAFWILKLRPSVNIIKSQPIILIEDLPYGAPTPHHTGKLHNVDPREMVAAK